MRRLGALLVATVCFLVVFQQPAAAHGGGGVSATNFETTVDGISPALAGVRVRVIEAGNRLELRNDGAEVLVLGTDHEPYLRVGPDGSFENRRSPTAELNTGPNHNDAHDPVVKGEGDATAAPEWRKLSDAPLVRWHHHPAHWNAPRDPPEVEAAPGERHVVYPRWEVELRRGDQQAVVFGRLTWVPGPSPAPWFALLAGMFVAVGALGLLRRWGRPLALATAVVLTADLAHAVSVAFAFGGGLGTHLAKIVTGGFYALLGWGLAALAIRLLRRGKIDGLYAGVFAGLSMAVFGGLLDLVELSRSVFLSVLPVEASRLFVAVSAGGGLGLAAACLLVIMRTPDARRVVGGPNAEDGEPLDTGPERPNEAGDTGPERPNEAGDTGPERPNGAGDTGPERPNGAEDTGPGCATAPAGAALGVGSAPAV